MTNWILLRGLTRDSRHWGRFPQLLRACLPDANVVALDLPGNGVISSQRSPASVAAMTAFCRAELSGRGVLPPYHLLAMSLGAMVAMDWAAIGAQEVRACVLINSSLRRLSPFFRRLRPGTYPALLRLALGGGTEHQCEETILRLTSARAGSRAEVLEQWARFRAERPVARGNALRQLLAAARFRGSGVAPAARVLILASARDALVDPDCSRRLAAAWRATMAVHPAAGHDLVLDDGSWVAEQVARWWASSAGSGNESRSGAAPLQEVAPSCGKVGQLGSRAAKKGPR